MRLENFGSLRVLGTAVVGGVLTTALATAVWEPLGTPVGVAAFIALYVGLAASPTTVLYCPYCRKRVKLGATACHHCGRAVV